MSNTTPDLNPHDITASDRPRCDRDWTLEAVRIIEAELARSADTHLVKVDIPNCPVDVYFKDESTHPTGSLKHRLARSLFLFSICNGWIGPGTTVIESSSGSTAVSEAYFARLLGLRFIAVMPRSTSQEKVDAIAHYGGECHLVDDPASVYDVSARLAASCHGHYIDQFTYAERATDWRGNNNVAESIFRQMKRERFAEPDWIVVGCGTGGTSATIGRYVRYQRQRTKLCIADPVDSVFHRHMRDPSIRAYTAAGSLIEGIGRPRLEPSFVPSVVDRAVAVPDAASIAAARALSRRLGRGVGGTTGTNLWAVAGLVSEMCAENRAGSIVSLLCDSGDRYRSSYYDDGWVKAKGLDLAPYEDAIERLFAGETCAAANLFVSSPG